MAALSSSLIPPRKTTESPKRASSARISRACPRPAMRKRAPRTVFSTVGMASARIRSPLRGSSRRPRKEMVGASSVPRKRGSSLGAQAKGATLIPLGMTTASPP